jgi:hypothetical protein
MLDGRKDVTMNIRIEPKKPDDKNDKKPDDKKSPPPADDKKPDSKPNELSIL